MAKNEELASLDASRLLQHTEKTATNPNSHSDELCARCAKTPWSEYLKWNESRACSIRITETANELRNSTCRLCRLLATIKYPSSTDELEIILKSWSNFDQVISFRPAVPVESSGLLHKQPIGLGLSRLNPAKGDPGWEEITKKLPNVANIELARDWIKECKDTHSSGCQPKSQHVLRDLRVIDCERRVVIQAPDECEYIALSYVWGKYPTMQELTSSGLPIKLPATIDDAIAITELLGFHYLWVDQYCIKQDDPQDKLVQIQQMGNVYACAQLILVAAAGDDATHGLPGVRTLRPVCSNWYERVGKIALVLCPIPVSTAVELSRWATRAWTFQEGHLSTRRLFFTDCQMIYVCNDSTRPEIHNDVEHDIRGVLWSFERLFSLTSTSDEDPLSKFSTALNYIEEYSSRQLSYDSDTLNAITGILNTLQSEPYPSYHLCGVPVAAKTFDHADIQVGLGWYHTGRCRRRFGFPTWSSLGWIGLVEHYRRPVVQLNVKLRVRTNRGFVTLSEYIERDASQQSQEQPFIPMILEMTVQMLPVRLHKSPSESELEEPAEEMCVVLPWTGNLDIYQAVSWDEDQTEHGHKIDTDSFFCVVLQHCTSRLSGIALILSQRDEHFERIGSFRFPHKQSIRRLMWKDESVMSIEDFVKDKKVWRNPMWVKAATERTIAVR